MKIGIDLKYAKDYGRLMRGEITNKEFEELTGLEPEENNPSRKDWLKRNG
jgi:hypothetical protein